MSALSLHEEHARSGAEFGTLGGQEMVRHYGHPPAEYEALRSGCGLMDLSFRGRLVLTGEDRLRFLNGQVTNDLKPLTAGMGCYAALVTAKGKMQSDLHIYNLGQELLLDFEPGLTDQIIARLDKYIIADDVQVMDVAPLYHLLSFQGPKSAEVVAEMNLGLAMPCAPHAIAHAQHPEWGEIYLAHHARLGSMGYDLYLPADSSPAAVALLHQFLSDQVRWCGWDAFEVVRIEAGLPRFGQDMDETNLPSEARLEGKAISYTKGCYIGQEIIARLRTYGQVAKSLQRLEFAAELSALPPSGTRLFAGEREVGYITSATESPTQGKIGLGYVRREHNKVGTILTLPPAHGGQPVAVAALPA